jgi:hypothetical protein
VSAQPPSRGAARRRRLRLGPGQASGWSPYASSSTRGEENDNDFWLEREIEQLERALKDQGELRRRELGRAVGCRYWGPGRFRHALSAAVDQGRIRRVGFGRYAPLERSGS